MEMSWALFSRASSRLLSCATCVDWTPSNTLSVCRARVFSRSLWACCSATSLLTVSRCACCSARSSSSGEAELSWRGSVACSDALAATCSSSCSFCWFSRICRESIVIWWAAFSSSKAFWRPSMTTRDLWYSVSCASSGASFDVQLLCPPERGVLGGAALGVPKCPELVSLMPFHAACCNNWWVCADGDRAAGGDKQRGVHMVSVLTNPAESPIGVSFPRFRSSSVILSAAGSLTGVAEGVGVMDGGKLSNCSFDRSMLDTPLTPASRLRSGRARTKLRANKPTNTQKAATASFCTRDSISR
mmetsp:Transcript_97476/g.168106  ORF Transcript_97476/g.168106 Transcript_97476/m.168106 type:complete len:302 (+) Transcript_97476:1026-1931(+)